MSEESVKCPNYELCTGQSVPGMGSTFCMSCGSWFKMGGFGWDKLNIIDCDEECDVCMNICKRKLLFPTKCGHSFCLECSKEVLFWDECKYHLSPVPYGCPPCPNGCENPERGKQCYCDEYYDVVIEQWKQTNPVHYLKWDKEQEISIDNGNDNTSSGKGVCPMCRKEYIRKDR